MTANEIRKKFLDFFASKGHSIIASDSLIPKDDDTVLFTTAGMQQFKPQFLGHIKGFRRAATSQKCLRTDDLDMVGKTDFHHTFFEMLGNFSFGDYFKEEAICWAWEFLTKELGIEEDKLWVSVYKDDKEAEEIWLNKVGISPEKIVRLGDHSNFWPADAKEKGPNGPCGPCSEIFYDYGPNPECKNANCNPACDCGRFSEVWNLVFTQFERKDGGELIPLPNKNIDTGMGLERISAVVQGKKNNFEIDLFVPILAAIDKFVNVSDKRKLTRYERYRIADHIRAVVFAIADGVIPSNEGRGYVIKKLIIDMADIALNIQSKSDDRQSSESNPVIFRLVPSVLDAMGDIYPEISQKSSDISELIKTVESSYIKVRKERVPALRRERDELVERLDRLSAKEAADELGRLIFKYRDTFGLTLSVITAVLEELDWIKDKYMAEAIERFNSLMRSQQEKSRTSSKISASVFDYSLLDLGLPKTEFLGYKMSRTASTVLKIFVEGKSVNEVEESVEVKIALDKTPFYAESGGQVGDTGYICAEGLKVRIYDTHKIDEIFIHCGIVEKGRLKVNEQVHAEIDIDRRMAIMRNHTATHLLQAALREILGDHVKQQGSYVGEDRLRFDFSHHKGLTAEQLSLVERKVNEYIIATETVTKEYLPIEEAKHTGALAFFGERYSDIVRVVSIGNYSKEFCGGTHVDNTGQIGLFKIISETAVAQGIRRIEAKTGFGALDFVNFEENLLKNVASILKVPVDDVVERTSYQLRRIKALEKDVAELRFSAIKSSLDKIISSAEVVNGVHIIKACFNDVDISTLRRLADIVRQKCDSAVVLLGSRFKSEVSMLVAVSENVINRGIKANELIAEIAPIMNGSGGGRAQMAQAGSKDIAKFDKVFNKAEDIVKEKINKSNK